MERAARMWEAVLDDPVTVTIDVRELPIHSTARLYRPWLEASSSGKSNGQIRGKARAADANRDHGGTYDFFRDIVN